MGAVKKSEALRTLPKEMLVHKNKLVIRSKSKL